MASYKIALVLDDSLDPPDGVQQYVVQVGQWLTAQGHEVHYIVGHTERTDLPHIHSIGRNIKVRFNQNRMSIPLPVPRKRIASLLEQEQFDIIHVQMPYSPFLAGRVIRAVNPKTTVVGTFHVAPYNRRVSLANALLGRYVKHTSARFDGVMSVSEVAKQFARKTFFVESSIVPNTIAIRPFLDARPFDIYKNSLNIVFFGRLVERKGCQYFLQAIHRLHQDGALPTGTKVIVCGKGHMATALQEYVTKNGLEALVTFTGFVSEADKPRYLASGDLVVYPSTGGESFGIVLLEGMGASRGVILAGDNPGYRSVLGKRPGSLFNPLDIPAFAEKLKRYIADPALREEAHRWQQTQVQNFDLSVVGKQIVGVYETALHKHQA